MVDMLDLESSACIKRESSSLSIRTSIEGDNKVVVNWRDVKQ